MQAGVRFLHKVNWDDLRYVLAVASEGSVARAARRLGVNHATVLRRVTAFEEAAGGPVFERSAQGYRLRPDRAAVIEAAREAEEALARAAAHLRGDRDGAGTVMRLTSVDSLCTTVLADGHARIARRIAPHRLEMVVANAHLDLARLQADMTVRPALHLPEEMTGCQVAEMGLGVYAVADAPETWLGLSGPLASAVPGRWMAENVPPGQVAGQADSFVVLRELARRGQGRAILPCILGDAAPELVRLDVTPALPGIPVWVATHRDLAGRDRIERLRGAVTAVLEAQADALAGRVR